MKLTIDHAAHEVKIRQLLSPTFRAEVHHLLWRERFNNERGESDGGWFCRDHAILVGMVARLLGVPASLAWGKACFVQGPTNQFGPVGYRQDNHAFLGIEGAGLMDLSARLDRTIGDVWRPWQLDYIAFSRCHPDGELYFVIDQGEFDSLVNRATLTTNVKTAVYLIQGNRNMCREMLENPKDHVNSPLTGILLERYGPSVYARCVVHLYKMMRGERKSVAHLPQMAAWENIAEQSGDPVSWVTNRAKLDRMASSER